MKRSPGSGRQSGSRRVPFSPSENSSNWQPTPVFLPGESQGRGSLVGRHLWGRTESATAEVTQQQQQQQDCEVWWVSVELPCDYPLQSPIGTQEAW